jgi:hypothetical protein
MPVAQIKNLDQARENKSHILNFFIFDKPESATILLGAIQTSSGTPRWRTKNQKVFGLKNTVKFEARNPKSETISKFSKSEFSNVLNFEFLSFVFVSDFDIRISDF